MTPPKIIWCSTEKQGDRHLYTIFTRDANMHNTMIAADEMSKALTLARDDLRKLHQGIEVNITKTLAAIDAALPKTEGE